MDIQIDAAEIAALRIKVAEVYGQKIETPKDFDGLSVAIWDKCRKIISATTLKRIWLYISGGSSVRLSSLDILSEYVGLADWNDFLVSLQTKGRVESCSFDGKGLNVSDINVGESVVVTWLPNRRCVFRYQGDGMFVVTHSRYSKLRVGDRFVAACFLVGVPLYIDNLVRKDEQGETSYVAGKEHGLTSVSKL